MSKGENIRANISNDYEKTPGYLIWDITEAVGQEMDSQEESILEAARKLDVDNLTGDELTKFVYQRKGVIRKAATYATGQITVNGTGTVTKGDLFETPNGVQFAATETVNITDSSTVNIKAVQAGNVGVVGSGTITQMPVTIAGINSCTNAEPTHDGYDAESDDALRERYYIALRTPPSSGNKYSYQNWALEVEGVGAAEVFPLAHGENTVDVVVIDSDMQPASSQLVAAVQSYIDPDSSGKGEGTAPMGAHCYVSAAEALSIDITVKLTTSGTQTETENAVKEAIKKYLASIAFTGENVSYAQIGNAIIDTAGVIDYENLTVNSGSANISVADRKVAVIGTVVFTYA